MKLWLLVLGSFLLLGATFQMHTDGKYRVFIGGDRQTDWVDVCCRYNERLELVYADYTPIEQVTIERTKSLITYYITKGYSKWKLQGVEGNPTSWKLQWLP